MVEHESDEVAKKRGKTVIERDWLVKKLNSLASNAGKKKLVDAKLDITKTRQLQLLQISSSSFYYKPVPISEIDLKMMNRIDEIYTDISSSYGYRYMYHQLIEEGYSIGINKVLKFMRVIGIQAIYPKKKRNTSLKDQEHKIYSYVLKEYANDKKQIVATHSNHIWSGDITYIRLNGSFMYLAAIIDWDSKCILSYKLSNTMDSELVTDVLQQAMDRCGIPNIFNSDQAVNILAQLIPNY